MHTLVSIIVPNYNHSQFLKLRLDSIFNQTYQNFEVILLDDYSSDGSRDVLLEYKNHPKVSHCLFNEENSGNTFKQWNKGIFLAQGEFVWIAESDDFSEETFLEKLLKPFSKHNEVAITFCQSYRMDALGNITGNWITHTCEFEDNIFNKDFVLPGYKFIEKYLIHKNVIPNVSGVLFKKSELIKIIPLIFKSCMKYNADWFYYLQLLCNTKVAFIAEPLNYFRYHPSSVIAKAGEKSGWLKIFEMELEARNEMLKYLKKCKLKNYPKIKNQSNIGNNKLKHIIAENYINQGKILKGLTIYPKKLFWSKKLFLKILRNQF